MTPAALDVSQIGPMSGGYGCALCGSVFGTLTGFDAHQVRDYSATPPITCKAPDSLGYVLDERGVWRTPEGRAQRDRNAARLARSVRERWADRDGPVRIDDSLASQDRARPVDWPSVGDEVKRLLGL